MMRVVRPAVPPTLFLILIVAMCTPSNLHAQTIVTPRLTLDDPSIQDQDDMCIWIHPSDPTQSTIVTSDKTAGKLFVYDLAGTTLQVIDLPDGKPGNIDLRYNFDLHGHAIDIVGVNERNSSTLFFYRVDPESRTLERIDNGLIQTAHDNYGLSLYHSPVSQKHYVFSSTQNGTIEQFELIEASGLIDATLVRSWDIGGITEGSVCDDENGVVFFGEEDVGIWKFGAEPGDPVVGTSVATVGDSTGIVADIEGLTLYYAANGKGYLIASSQGNSSFRVFQREAPHAFVDSFTVADARRTDGIDVTNVNLGPSFPKGIFLLHNDRTSPKPIEVCAYEDLGLLVDTEYWDPRSDSSVPTLLALGRVHAEPARVQLTWYGGGATGRTATIYRRTEATEWASVAVEVVDGTGKLVYEDDDVQPGVRYGYRLGIQEHGADVFLGEVWVEVPTGFQLALHGLRPNPSERDLVIAFSLSDGRPANVEILDVAGRQLWSRSVDLGPGSHVLNLGYTSTLPPGHYLLRLTQGDVSVFSRATILR